MSNCYRPVSVYAFSVFIVGYRPVCACHLCTCPIVAEKMKKGVKPNKNICIDICLLSSGWFSVFIFYRRSFLSFCARAHSVFIVSVHIALHTFCHFLQLFRDCETIFLCSVLAQDVV